MKQSAFIAALKFASHAMAAKDIRYYLNGVCIELIGDAMILIGTDGHRMAYATIEDDNSGQAPHWPDRKAGDNQYIISADGVKMILAMFKANSTGHMDFEFTRETVTVSGAAGTLPLKPIEGVYPDWRRVCKADAKPVGVESIGVNGDYLASACKAAGAYAGGKYGGMLLKFHGSNDAIRVEPTPLPAGCTEAAVIVMPMRT